MCTWKSRLIKVCFLVISPLLAVRLSVLVLGSNTCTLDISMSQWQSARLEMERSLVSTSPKALWCVIKKNLLSYAYD